MLIKFLAPYILFCFSAAYSILQTLDGIGLVSTIRYENNSVSSFATMIFTPDEQARNMLPVIIGSMVFIIILLLTAAYVLRKKTGVIICAIILILPGLLAMSDYFPSIRWFPYNYNIGGAGEVGSPVGMSCLVITGIITGWAVLILIQAYFRAGERFRTVFDIFLILTAAANGIFWVHDKEVSSIQSAYQETSRVINSSNAYLLKQVEYYDERCKSGVVKNALSCQWASDIQGKLNDYTYQLPSVFLQFTPDTVGGLYKTYGMSDSKAEKIREELNEYNMHTCPEKKLGQGVIQLAPSSRLCQETPSNYCDAIIEDQYRHVASGEVAIASECVFSSLLRNKKILKKEKDELSESSKSSNFRWLWFVLLSIFLGGKIATLMYKIRDSTTVRI
ncbi:hypothetical protein [Type-D symbiont of Plautia stali]|uniref:hypothetical protein n=1 Tax=Type-D symbiont of Plautia stali TaxID=1560356 RepID=UPI000B109A7F|nr:hypothetical protein [Type-D symbiont of Plautia stali]